jgi:lipid II:glycine glycyltransferase (peptidoglycan interpeptide bridge formation enzyme)
MKAAKRIDKALVNEDILYDDLDLKETRAIMDDFRAWLKATREREAIAAARREFYDNMIEAE